MAERQRQIKYDWRRTWGDVPEDYLAYDGEWKIGRVHRVISVSSGGWHWTCNARLEWLGSEAGKCRDQGGGLPCRRSRLRCAASAHCGGQGLEAGSVRLREQLELIRGRRLQPSGRAVQLTGLEAQVRRTSSIEFATVCQMSARARFGALATS